MSKQYAETAADMRSHQDVRVHRERLANVGHEYNLQLRKQQEEVEHLETKISKYEDENAQFVDQAIVRYRVMQAARDSLQSAVNQLRRELYIAALCKWMESIAPKETLRSIICDSRDASLGRVRTKEESAEQRIHQYKSAL